MYWKAIAVWLLLMLLAIANGGLRSLVLAPAFGETAGRILSTIVLAGTILAAAWATIRWIGPRSKPQSVRIGVLWLALTLAFEFGAGRYLFGAPWGQLFEDYNVLHGRIWVLVLAACAVSPVWAGQKRNLYAHKQAPRSGGIM